MASHSRIYNQTRGYSLKYKQALRAIENCSACWVIEGETIRDLTISEAIQARNEQAKLREELPVSELPNIRYKAPASDLKSDFWERRASLLRQAGQFVSEAIQ